MSPEAEGVQPIDGSRGGWRKSNGMIACSTSHRYAWPTMHRTCPLWVAIEMSRPTFFDEKCVPPHVSRHDLGASFGDVNPVENQQL